MAEWLGVAVSLVGAQRCCALVEQGVSSRPPRLALLAKNLETFSCRASYVYANAQRRHPAVSSGTRGLLPVIAFLAAAFRYAPLNAPAQTSSAPSSTSARGERWLHVRVGSSNSKGETVRINVPLELAEKVLPAIDHDRLHNGKVKFNDSDMNGVDLKTILDALRSSKDGEFVTVQSTENDARVAKQNGYMLVPVT